MKKARLLVVDDEIFLVETLRDRLEFVGYDVLSAENGAEALTKLQSNAVDLILMDCMMPVMDGLQATQLIKGHDKLKKKPVIFLTARARKEDREEALRAGADDYLPKPFEMDDLLKMIEKWLKK
ncbi:MAG: response regulator [Deltaproteobacteria bacterium]|nr:response regulator [Deltaproteobacteria bacterium]MBI4373908.1 response regulator [Deltaproteobacteria bacterium]